MNKQEQLKVIMSHIEVPKSDLDVYDVKDYRFLFAVILSSRTTDVLVNKTTPILFEKFPTLDSFAEADWEDIAQIVKPLGPYRNKAKNLVKCANQLINDYNREIPSDMKSLTSLGGVGRKVANVIRNCVHGMSGVVVDTHVARVAQRLNWTENKNATKIEKDLAEWIPEQDQADASNSLVLFGRYTCEAKKPRCTACPLNNLCPSRRYYETLNA